jgi:polyhydroxyalkanoate synthesis regulator phasin
MASLPAPNFKHLLELGMGAVEPRRAQVRKVVNDLVAQGQVARDQASATVEEIVALGQARTEELRNAVRSEVSRQIRALGLVTQDDLASLERRLSRRTAAAAKKSSVKPAAKKSAKPTAAKAARPKKAASS